LHIHATHDCQIEVWDIQKRAEAFEKVFGRGLVVSVLPPLPGPVAPSAVENHPSCSRNGPPVDHAVSRKLW
jgi:hypothetical protein